MMFTILECTEANDQLRAFESRERPRADQEHRGDLQLDFQKYRYTFVAVAENEEIAGLLKMTLETQNAHIDDLLVGHARRRKGVGTLLVKHAEEFSRQQHCYKIRLDTLEERDAMKLYETLGYEKTAVLEKHYFGKRAIIFTKYL